MTKVDKINEIMRNNGMCGEVYDEVHDENNHIVAVEIVWGDWKHSHLRLDWLVQKEMPELKKIQEKVTEEDGSDCYSAIHRFYF